jgi:hypothetical protein
VVSIKDAIEDAFCSAERVTFVGSMTPDFTRSWYSEVAALNPKFESRLARIVRITVAAS